MNSDVIRLEEVDHGSVGLVGGKGARLGELLRIEGVCVPEGFCVTTHAFQRVVLAAPSLQEPLERLSHLQPGDRDELRVLSAHLRQVIVGVTMPDGLVEAICRAHAQLGQSGACAVRSSATAEDTASASFAGQQDTFLNVLGTEEVLKHVTRCWASLFTERAVTYRLRNSWDHRTVQMAVVVQRMVEPEAAGVLMTADPLSGDRTVTSVEASFGLGAYSTDADHAFHGKAIACSA